MKYLFDQNLNELLRTKGRIFLFLDFDGTLSPIVKNPSQAKLPKAAKEILKTLAKNKKIVLAIISGRSLADIQKRVGISKIAYAGSHGLEVFLSGRRIVTNKLSRRFETQILKPVKENLAKALQPFKGVIFEDKGQILAIHYRKVSSIKVPKLKAIFNRVTESLLNKGKISLGQGKKVLELRPNLGFSKQDAVKIFEEKFKKKKRELTIFIGDDLTDEAIFKALKKPNLAIRVGKTKQSRAKYFLNNPAEVRKFLKTLARMAIL